MAATDPVRYLVKDQADNGRWVKSLEEGVDALLSPDGHLLMIQQGQVPDEYTIRVYRSGRELGVALGSPYTETGGTGLLGQFLDDRLV